MPKRTPICVRLTKHPRYKFQVTAPPELNGGSRTRKLFATRKEAQTHAADLQVQKENFGTRLLQIPEPLRQEALACAERLQPFQTALTEAVTFFVQHRQNAQKSCTVTELGSQAPPGEEVGGTPGTVLERADRHRTRPRVI